MIATRKWRRVLVLAASGALFAACSPSALLTDLQQHEKASDAGTLASEMDITAFSIVSPAAAGIISGTSINVTVPFGTSVTALVASFTTTGAAVKVGAAFQASGTTANDFTSPVTYTVIAADSTTKTYAVTVTAALASSKDITAFSIVSPLATGTILGTAINVTVPFGTSVTALVASFATTGATVNVGAAIQASGTTANNFTSPVTYTVTAADSTTKTYTVTVAVALSSGNDITAFSFVSPPAMGTIVGTAIDVTVPFGTPVTALVASFATTGATVKVGAAIQASGTTANDFISPVIYTVTAADSTMKNYTVTITVAPSPNKDITAFSIVSPSATGTIVGTAINVTVPFGTNVLAASFTTTGASVKVAGTMQTSGVTVNDFASPVTYTVTAADSSTKNYTVTVTVLPLTFNYTGSQQSWTVPAGVTKIRVTATGAAGGLGALAAPGAGGQTIADINVTPGDTWYFFVGGAGGPGGPGWNGGGIDAYSNTCTYGGGATDIRHGGTALTDRVLVVGGGGGVGANGFVGCGGGYGAGTYNANGGDGETTSEATGGGGGTQVSGGVGGIGTWGNSGDGALGIGSSNPDYGGAGGGGYYGGGSGGTGFNGQHAGGGGGSSYLDTNYGTYLSGTNGFNSSTDGSVVVENVSP